MKTLLLTPQDLLFFRDGRPMSGSLAGYGAAWPLPHLIHQAFHAAFHRAGLDSHVHRNGRSGVYTAERGQRFGSLKTLGPFPVSPGGEWFAPISADTAGVQLIRVPSSSLPAPLRFAVAAAKPPTKEKAKEWASFNRPDHHIFSTDIFSAESRIGIGIDPATQTQDGERIYTARYLRLRDGWRFGICAEANDKEHGDLMETFLSRENRLVMGGQQGICTIQKTADSPLAALTCPPITSNWIKWTLLSPALFPAIGRSREEIIPHPGGWLPNWVHPETGAVMLPCKMPRRQNEPRTAWRERVRATAAIPAHLRAALVPKPIMFSGWSLENGAKPTQLAVPAGAVYYFEAETVEAAQMLAATLHLTPRSTLFGEKGFGLGVCDPPPPKG